MQFRSAAVSEVLWWFWADVADIGRTIDCQQNGDAGHYGGWEKSKVWHFTIAATTRYPTQRKNSLFVDYQI